MTPTFVALSIKRYVNSEIMTPRINPLDNSVFVSNSIFTEYFTFPK